MSLEDRLCEIFERGLEHDGKNLSPADRELYLIRDFILDYEMNGLGGYFYNKLPDLDVITETVNAMSARGMSDLAALLGEAAALFRGYTNPKRRTTWGKLCRHYDPEGRLDELNDLVMRLDNYGLDEASTTWR